MAILEAKLSQARPPIFGPDSAGASRKPALVSALTQQQQDPCLNVMARQVLFLCRRSAFGGGGPERIVGEDKCFQFLPLKREREQQKVMFSTHQTIKKEGQLFFTQVVSQFQIGLTQDRQNSNEV
jgi:hypothetical protein